MFPGINQSISVRLINFHGWVGCDFIQRCHCIIKATDGLPLKIFNIVRNIFRYRLIFISKMLADFISHTSNQFTGFFKQLPLIFGFFRNFHSLTLTFGFFSLALARFFCSLSSSPECGFCL
ncbi:Uncharacterised protein [Klebsiella pneumoniae]|uniref:Uncharacterized protein n=1 Tax=Klebsiella pneumoniae TaxID=573 RepID=A0A509AIW4_KLEPN|nr:Uncharacterised protein [Klebsiella pneumoniae]